MKIIIKIKKWGKRVGGTVDPKELEGYQAFKEYIANIKIHVIFIKQSFLLWTLSYEKK